MFGTLFMRVTYVIDFNFLPGGWITRQINWSEVYDSGGGTIKRFDSDPAHRGSLGIITLTGTKLPLGVAPTVTNGGILEFQFGKFANFNAIVFG